MEGRGGAWPTCNYYAAAPFNRAQDWTHKKFCLRRAAIGTVAGNVLISDKQRHFFPRPFRAPVSPRCAGFCRPSLDDLLPVIIACRSNGENIKLSANTAIPMPLPFPSEKNINTDAFRLNVYATASSLISSFPRFDVFIYKYRFY